MNLKAFLRNYAAPVSKDHGLVRSGSDFKLTSSSGSTAILFFEEIRVDSRKVVFGVSYCVIPAVYWDWVTRYDGDTARPAGRSGAFVTRFILPPEGLSYDPEDDGYFRRMWSYGAGMEQECGSALRECLTDEVIPEMARMLDLGSLLAELRNPTRPGVSSLSQDLCEIFVGIETMPSEKLDQALAEAERNGAARSLISWIRQHSQAGSQ
ncbi:hypothetical protein ACFC0D_28950 [Streptomyces sp. NPDC056222]|uniref:hypothetical protein n=1 Tax=Streptomyces sp. NPDC056222 TaxID=3345749 RepID=UPI0035E07380